MIQSLGCGYDHNDMTGSRVGTQRLQGLGTWWDPAAYVVGGRGAGLPRSHPLTLGRCRDDAVLQERVPAVGHPPGRLDVDRVGIRPQFVEERIDPQAGLAAEEVGEFLALGVPF